MARSTGFGIESNWRVLFRDLGLDPAVVLRRADLPEDLLNREDVRLNTREYFRF